MLSPFELISVLLVLTAGFAWTNHRLIGLPDSVGLLIMGLAASVLLLLAERVFPQVQLYEQVGVILQQVDFQRTVLEGMLAFLLFAGALHVDLSVLRERAWAVGSMATIGVLLSTLIVGLSFWCAASLAGINLPLSWAFVFGALISPTDPVAVLGTLKAVRVPKSLELDMTGESLFNDGVGVVIFTIALAIAAGAGHGATGFSGAAELFAIEAIGGALLGFAAGYIAYRAMKQIDNFSVEVLISLGLVMGTYALAARLGTSGPIAMVVAGLLIGNRGPRDALSDLTQRYLFGFWTLVDEILNAILFLLIGLEVLVLRPDVLFAWLPASAILLVLLARLAAVALPVWILSRWTVFVPGTIPVLTWGGLRGGISVALALSIPEVEEKAIILAATYLVVVFTLIVQGLSLRRLVQRTVR
ncbi:cation:proton antiporter [Teichococcus vastitatis]|jgi:CPA1 family monovalent cation:H+ antiporter|uniref:Sodium:proton antiporter n=1 Tax=Teichococcus vastitatis TaxID=2307076 RepID=A0ABS9W918_9PROT|nr:sodium:proton antiporter [Pseudoroseomonas vastitatis]MCI0755794.1 sodium:proton antiporter [Pseudoroseomonas vastitatis]